MNSTDNPVLLLADNITVKHIFDSLPKSAEVRNTSSLASSSCFTDQVDYRTHDSFAVAIEVEVQRRMWWWMASTDW